jgi:hypothetical protein
VRDLPTSLVTAADGPQTAARLVGMPEWVQRAGGAKEEAGVLMSQQKARKGVGRPHGKPKPEPDVSESAVMTLREVAEYLDCHTPPSACLPSRGKFPVSGWVTEWRFLKSELDKWIAEGGGLARS